MKEVPEGFIFRDKPKYDLSKGKGYETDVWTSEGKSKGFFIRYYDAKTKSFTFDYGFMKKGNYDRLPSMVKDVKIPLVPGKGTPTQAYVTIRQMKLLEIPPGGIDKVKMNQIQNIETGMYLAQIMKQKEIKDIEKVTTLLDAPSMQYVKTVMTQSKYKLTNARILSVNKGYKTMKVPLGDLKNKFGYDIKETWLKQYKLTLKDEIFINYDITIKAKYVN